jgi:hypothetical protein
MPREQQLDQRLSVRLTQAQRKVVAETVPEVAERLKLDEPNQRTVQFTLAELKAIKERAGAAAGQASTGMRRNSLRHIVTAATQALERSQGSGVIPAGQRVFQFKITLRDTQPPIWRRIRVKDGTLDKLHEHIQTAMGWTNSHLHHFKVGEQHYGDPMLLGENFEEFDYRDSMRTKVSAVVPQTGKRFRCEYEYDFGDSWWHEVLFEGVVCAEPGQRYPLCLDGARACPPEDVGGVWGYADFVQAMADPEDERHEELVQWLGEEFAPEAFDPVVATARMRQGLPDWRRMD